MSWIKRLLRQKSTATEPEMALETPKEHHVAGFTFLVSEGGDITLDVFSDETNEPQATLMLAKLLVDCLDGSVLQQAVAVVQGNLKNTGQDDLLNVFTAGLLEFGANKQKFQQDSNVDKPCAIPSESTP